MARTNPPREQDPTIQGRRQGLYEADAPPSSSGAPAKPFAQYLRETPPAPLGFGLKAGLWALGALVALLLVAALLRMAG